MKKIIIFGNAGSGKSTLARQFVKEFSISHLDLDSLAWKDTKPPSRELLDISKDKINHFIEKNNSWVIEGGYSDLLAVTLAHANEMIFLDLDVNLCIKNCLARPWEPHKYHSIDAQNENLNFLIHWVKQYPFRDEAFSLRSHQKLFNDFNGKKIRRLTNER